MLVSPGVRFRVKQHRCVFLNCMSRHKVLLCLFLAGRRTLYKGGSSLEERPVGRRSVFLRFSLRLPARTQVAATIVKGLKAGDFCITFGAEGFLVGLGTAGFAPCFSVTQAVCQVRRQMR